MRVTVDPTLLSAFLLVLARTSAWSVASPLLSSRDLSGIARLAVAVALAVFATPLARIGNPHIPTDIAGFASALMAQIGIGLALGFLSGLVLYAVQAAGSLADLSAGFSYGSLIDPMSGTDAATFSRLASVTLLALLFVTDAAGVIVAGFARSFTSLPLGGSVHLSGGGIVALGNAMAGLISSAVEIAGPIIGVTFLADFGLALVSRFVPQANALNLAMPLKALVGLGAFGTVLTLLPGRLAGLIDGGFQLINAVLLK